MSTPCKVFPDVEAAAAACAAHIRSVIESATAGNGTARVAFSGGSSPKPMFGHLVRAGIDWSRVHIFQVDERAVPPDDPESNYGMMEEHLIRPARIPDRNIHRIHAEFSPQQAARRYEDEIREVFSLERGELPHFDLLHLGVGPDAHTASLFPGERLIEDRSRIAAAVHVEKLGKWRITLLPGVLLAARNAAVLVSGDDKAEALRNVFHAPCDPVNYPAQLVAQHARRAFWFVDAPAARALESSPPA